MHSIVNLIDGHLDGFDARETRNTPLHNTPLATGYVYVVIVDQVAENIVRYDCVSST